MYAKWLLAEAAFADAGVKSYSMGDRTLQREDLTMISRQVEKWRARAGMERRRPSQVIFRDV